MIRSQTLPMNIADIPYLRSSFQVSNMGKAKPVLPIVVSSPNDPSNGEINRIENEFESVCSKLQKMRQKSVDFLTSARGSNNSLFYDLEEIIQKLEKKKKELRSQLDEAYLTYINGLMTLPVPEPADFLKGNLSSASMQLPA